MKKSIRLMLLFLLIIILTVPTLSFATDGQSMGIDLSKEETMEAIDDFASEINFLANALLAISAVSSVLIFIIHFVKLGAVASYPIMRRKVMRDLLISAVCTAGIGGFGLIFKLYIGIFM